MPYTSDDRRGAEPGRRAYDGVCVFHDEVWKSCSDEKKAMWNKIDGAVTWKVFAFLVPIALGLAGWGFSYFATSVKELDHSVRRLELKSENLRYRMEQIEKAVKP